MKSFRSFKMKRYIRDLWIQLLIFSGFILLYFLLDLKHLRRQEQYPTEYYDEFKPKVLLSTNMSTLERMVEQNFRRQRAKIDKFESVRMLQSKAGELTLYEHGFNVKLSDTISYIRHLPDYRHNSCKTLHYNGSKPLPTASVVIVFRDVPLSMLLRTVHSILHRSNDSLLQEIVLVDDASIFPDLHHLLEYYLSTRFPTKVVLLHQKDRAGILKSRLHGAMHATGKVLIFMDAYVEPAEGWLEPLLHRISISPTSVVIPQHDEIDAHFLSYKPQALSIGGFTWSGQYYARKVPKRQMSFVELECDQPLATCPISTPVMPPNSVYAISHQLHEDLTYFDPRTVISDGKTIDMSFSIWLCTGKIEVVPCSRVGQLKLDDSYNYAEKATKAELAQIATDWWDKHAYYYFFLNPNMQSQPFYKKSKERKDLRYFLDCKDFDWYMKNVYPEKFVLYNVVYKYGRIASAAKDACVHDNLLDNKNQLSSVSMVPCNTTNEHSKFFYFTKYLKIQSEFNCLAVQLRNNSNSSDVESVPCTDIDEKYHYKWQMSHKNIVLKDTDYCLTLLEVDQSNVLTVQNCSKKDQTQEWNFAPLKKTKPTKKTVTKKIKVVYVKAKKKLAKKVKKPKAQQLKAGHPPANALKSINAKRPVHGQPIGHAKSLVRGPSPKRGNQYAHPSDGRNASAFGRVLRSAHVQMPVHGHPPGHGNEHGHPPNFKNAYGHPSDHSNIPVHGHPFGHANASSYGHPSNHASAPAHGYPSGHTTTHDHNPDHTLPYSGEHIEGYGNKPSQSYNQVHTQGYSGEYLEGHRNDPTHGHNPANQPAYLSERITEFDNKPIHGQSPVHPRAYSREHLEGHRNDPSQGHNPAYPPVQSHNHIERPGNKLSHGQNPAHPRVQSREQVEGYGNDPSHGHNPQPHPPAYSREYLVGHRNDPEGHRNPAHPPVQSREHMERPVNDPLHGHNPAHQPVYSKRGELK